MSVEKNKNKKTLYIVLIIILLVCLSQLWYHYQLNPARTYVYTNVCVDTNCTDKTYSPSRFMLGVGVHYNLTSNGGLDFSGNIISFFGKHFVFGQRHVCPYGEVWAPPFEFKGPPSCYDPNGVY